MMTDLEAEISVAPSLSEFPGPYELLDGNSGRGHAGLPLGDAVHVRAVQQAANVAYGRIWPDEQKESKRRVIQELCLLELC